MISILIYAEHENHFLEQCLRSLSALRTSAPAFEVIVIDSGNAPDREAFARTLIAGLEGSFSFVASQGETRRPALYNRAIAAARGDLLVFSHDDAFFPRDWLSSITAPLTDENVAFASGDDQVPPGQRSFLLSLDYVLHSPLATGGMRKDRGLRFGGLTPRNWNMACRKQLVESVGLFDAQAGESAEVEIAVRLSRLGFRMAYVPSPKIFHVRDTSLCETTALNVRRGRDRAALARSAGMARQAPFVGVMLATLAIPGSLLAVPVAPWLGLPALAYAVLLGGLALHAAWVWRRPAVALWTPLLTVSQHFGQGAGFLIGLLRPAARRR